MGNHNHAIGRLEESEGFIVMVKREKLRGVKGPYCDNANIIIGEAA